MIVTVCANPALDVTYRLPTLRHGRTHRVDDVKVRAGGKGTNVARVLRQLEQPVTLIAPLGARGLTTFRGLLGDIRLLSTAISGETRTCVVVADDHDATVFNERGPALTEAEWNEVSHTVAATLTPGDVLVLAGSLPTGVPTDAYARLVILARQRGARSIVDTHSEPLVDSLAAGPDVVAPNHLEASAVVGEYGVATCAALLRGRGAGAAVVSAGPRGIHADTDAGCWSAEPLRVVAGNPTGAGDALTAALAAGLHAGHAWPDIVCDAVASAAAAVACDVAGEVDLDLRAEFLATATARRH